MTFFPNKENVQTAISKHNYDRMTGNWENTLIPLEQINHHSLSDIW